MLHEKTADSRLLLFSFTNALLLYSQVFSCQIQYQIPLAPVIFTILLTFKKKYIVFSSKFYSKNRPMDNYTPPPLPSQKSGNNTQVLGILSLVSGIIALPASFIPCFGMIAIIVSVAAIVLGILAISSAKKHSESKGLGIAGLVLGAISFAIILLWGLLFASVTTAAIKNIDEVQKELDSMNNQEYEYYEEDESDSLHNQEDSLFIEEQVAE